MARTDRGDHPDLTPDGDVRDDAFVEPRRRDFNRTFADPLQRQVFLEHVARRQSQLPREIQVEIQGKTYAPGADAYTGYLEYEQAIETSKGYWRSGEVTSDDVARMSPAEYDRVFDERGQPREGYSFRATPRDLLTDVDQSTRDELRRR